MRAEHVQARVASAALSEVGRQVLDGIEAAVVLLDEHQRVVWFNPSAARLSSLPASAVGTPWDDHLPPGAAEEREQMRQVVAGHPRVLESVRIDPFGSEVPVRVTMTVVADGVDFTGMAVIAVDISEQRLMQEAVIEMARRTAETQSLAEVGLWVWDEATDNVQWTEELYRIHRLSPADFDGSMDAHLAPIPSDERQQVHQVLLEVLSTHEERDVTYPIDTSDGVRWIRSNVRPAGDDGKVSGLVGTCQDITRQQHYANAIVTANRELERVAGTLAHDLKTPLTVVVGMGDILRNMMDEDDPRTELAERIVVSGKQAAEMITELVTSARQAAMRRSLTPVDLDEVIGRVRTQLQLQLADVGATVVVADLPTVAGVDPLLRQMFFNLVGNAVKYRSPDRPLRVEIRGQVLEDGFVVRVVDNGTGIAPEQRHRVFVGGLRIDRDSTVEGHGLGLATCAEIMAQHNGTIHVEDGIDGGATMVCRFPPMAAAGVGDGDL